MPRIAAPTVAEHHARQRRALLDAAQALLARESREHGVATLMVTHDHDVLHHCDKVYEMVDGRLAPA